MQSLMDLSVMQHTFNIITSSVQRTTLPPSTPRPPSRPCPSPDSFLYAFIRCIYNCICCITSVMIRICLNYCRFDLYYLCTQNVSNVAGDYVYGTQMAVSNCIISNYNVVIYDLLIRMCSTSKTRRVGCTLDVLLPIQATSKLAFSQACGCIVYVMARMLYEGQDQDV